MRKKITPEQARAAYAVLVREAGARDDEWDLTGFVHHVAEAEYQATEYRFGGALGWGGKFRNNGNRGGVPYVDCYSEHLNPERQAIIDRTNAALAEIFQ